MILIKLNNAVGFAVSSSVHPVLNTALRYVVHFDEELVHMDKGVRYVGANCMNLRVVCLSALQKQQMSFVSEKIDFCKTFRKI